MNKINLNFWKRLSLSHKISSIGSIALILSLFLNWFSDIDVFRSGDIYSGLNGPLYFVGLSILVLASVNLILCLGKTANLGIFKKMSESELGKYQVAAGFGVMYLLIVVNSVYFSTQFGLNILSKKSEVGMMVALLSAVLLCVGGYLNFRKKFYLEESANTSEEMPIKTANTIVPNKVEHPLAPVFGGGLKKTAEIAQSIKENAPIRVEQEPVKQSEAQIMQEAASIYSERDVRGKTDYERGKMYENLKKVMMKDTMSPEQRRKEREKQIKENAFSSNFGKAPQAVSAAPTRKISTMDELLKRNQAETKDNSEKVV